ncbi:MAG TPA: helix-turn-helix domain-containing protein, partial [Micromonosporaceae bacterium]
RERAMYMGHDLSQPHVLLVARLDRPAAASPADAWDSHLPRLIGIIRAVAYPGRRLLVTSSRHHVVLLWPQPDQRDPHEVARVVRADVARAIRGQTASIAITGTCIDPGQYPVAYRMARGMLQLALLQGRRNATLSLEDLGLYGLLLQLDDPGELLRFAERVLRPVRDYDDRHGTTLLQTLRTAVETGRDRARTAAALHVHPNTVGIRIKRIESLLGRSLQSPSALLEVVAALMADDVSRSRYATQW